MNITRLYPGPDGQSHFEDIEVDFSPIAEGEQGAVIRNPKTAQFRCTPKGGFWDFHRADTRKYVIYLNGQAEVGIGDGTKRTFGPGDVVLIEDTTGQGHTLRVVGDSDRICLDIKLDP